MYLMLAVLPMVNVLAPAAWFIPPMTIGLALTAWLAYRRELQADLHYACLMLLCAVCFIPWIQSSEYISYKTIFHAFAVVASITVYYLGVRTALIRLVRAGAAMTVIQIIYVSLLLLSLFILFEFVGSNTGAWDVAQFVPYVDVLGYEAAVFGFVLRSRGFASEPGVMALYYDFVLFFVLPVLSKGWRWRFGYIFIIIPAYLCLFSTASLVCVGLVAAGLLMWRFKSHFLGSSLRLLGIAAVAAIALVAAREQVGEIADTLLVSRLEALVSDSDEDASASDRRQRLEQVLAVTAEHPLGIGFGIAAGLENSGLSYRGFPLAEGQISLYATFLLSGGVLALLMLIGIVGVSLLKAWRIPRFGPYIAAGGAAISLHHLSITEFWLPFFWFFMACASAYRYAPVTASYAR